MTKQGSERLIWRFLYSRVGLAILILLILYVGRSVWVIYQKDQLVRESRRGIEESLGKLQAKDKVLGKDIELLQTDRGIEEKIREKFPVVKPGEGVINIVAAPISTSTPDNTDSWWQKFLKIFY